MPDTPITAKQYAQIAAGLARRDDKNRPMRASDMQLNIAVACESDASGCFDKPFEELLAELRPCQRGKSAPRRASRRTYAGTRGGSRKRMEQHRLVQCSRAYTDERAPSGARKVTPWVIEPIAAGDGNGMPAWSGFAEWGRRVRADRELIACELVAAFRLSTLPAFASTGRLDGMTRKQLGAELCVEARTAMRLLRALDSRGHISLREEPVLDTRGGRGRRARRWSVTAQTTPVLPSAAEIAAAPTDENSDAIVYVAVGPMIELPDFNAEADDTEADDALAALLADPSWAAIIAETDAEFAAGAFDTNAPFEEPVASAPEPEPEQRPVASAVPDATVVEPVRLQLTRAQYSSGWVSALRALCTQPEHAGWAPVLLACPDGKVRALRTGRGGEPISVTPDEALDAAIKALPAPALAATPRGAIPVSAHEGEIALLPEKSTKRKRATKVEAAALRAQLWWPQLVDEAIAQAGRHHKGGAKTFTPSTLAAHFYEPVLALQGKYPAPIVEDALRKTIAKHIADAERWQTWAHYAAAICKRKGQQIGLTAPKPGTPAAEEAALHRHRRAARDLLARASNENSHRDTSAAHATLDELLALAPQLAPLFDGDIERAEYQLRLAVKQGSTDMHCARSRYGLDFLPEWSPDGEAPTDRAAKPTAPPSPVRPAIAAPTSEEEERERTVFSAAAPPEAALPAPEVVRQEHADAAPAPAAAPVGPPLAAPLPYAIQCGVDYDKVIEPMLRAALSSSRCDGDTPVVVSWRDGERPLMDGDTPVLVRAATKRERDYLDYEIGQTLVRWEAQRKETPTADDAPAPGDTPRPR